MSNTSKREILKVALLVIASLAFLVFAILVGLTTPKERVYDCTISEISPDYPIEVKEKCRKLRAKYI